MQVAEAAAAAQEEAAAAKQVAVAKVYTDMCSDMCSDMRAPDVCI